jgi:hypothetical protein
VFETFAVYAEDLEVRTGNGTDSERSLIRRMHAVRAMRLERR